MSRCFLKPQIKPVYKKLVRQKRLNFFINYSNSFKKCIYKTMLCCNKTVRQAADYVTKQGLHFLDIIHACIMKPWRKIEFFSFGEKTLN